jgi:hypothetical protein
MMIVRHAEANGMAIPEQQRDVPVEDVSAMPGNDFVLTGDHLSLTPDVGIDPVTREVHGLVKAIKIGESDWKLYQWDPQALAKAARRSPKGS